MTRLPFRAAALAAAALLAAAVLGAAARRAPTAGADVDPKTRAELVAARDAVWRAYFAGDTARLARLLTDTVVAIGWSAGEWGDRAHVLAGAAAFASGGGTLARLDFPRTEMLRFGDVAVVYSTFALELDHGGARTPVSGRATEVFVRRRGRWLNPSWHLDDAAEPR